MNKRRQQASVNVKELFNLSQGGKQGAWVVPACYAILAKGCVCVCMWPLADLIGFVFFSTMTDPAIKWMELRKQGKIKERETYGGEDTNVRTAALAMSALMWCRTLTLTLSQTLLKQHSAASSSPKRPSGWPSTTRASASTCACRMW